MNRDIAKHLKQTLLLFLFVVSQSSAAQAQGCDGCCSHCSHQANCSKVCRLVCEDKKVDVVCWGCETVEFCVPGPSTPDCEHCECVDCKNGEGVSKKVCSQPKKFVWTEWIPGCAKVFSKKKLMKRTMTKTVPSYKWVVEDVCSSCQSRLGKIDVSELQDVPDLPQEYAQFPLVSDIVAAE